jgi:hypothetical protein
MTSDEADLLHAFRYADSVQRRDALAALQSSLPQPSPVDALAPPSLVDLDLDTKQPAPRVPLRVAAVAHTTRPPAPPTPWHGWVD